MPIRGYKYRIYPTSRQEDLIRRTLGCTRFVYNTMLSESEEAHKQGERFTSRNAFNRRLTSLKREYQWLCEVDSTALTAANDCLADAFARFFKHQCKHPNYRKKKTYGSFTSKCVNQNIKVFDNIVHLPKLGDIKLHMHRLLPEGAVIKSATVSMENQNEFYISIQCSFDAAAQTPEGSGAAIGLDYKSDGLYADSNGNVANMPHFYRKAEIKLARYQRRLSRRTGSRKEERKSKNYLKQLRKVSKLERHTANQRKDFLHKLSTEIANQYDIVCVESLNMAAMSNKGFGNGKATLDNGYGMFLSMLEYKLSERNKHLVKVDKWFPSSQICHCCGSLHPEMKDLQIRTMKCDCGLTISRDQNAAINILREGLRQLTEAS